jgi:endoglucanase
MYEVVRGLAPALPIVLSGPMSSWIDGLVDAWVVDDPNVVYTIHVYDPFVFTHQGADWTVEPGLVEAVAIPFPALPGPCSTAIEAQPTPAAAMLVTDYCAQGYDEEWVRHRLETAARWAAERGVVLFLGEFGVSPTANVADAARWFAAVTDAAEEFGIGWSVWSLDAAMGPRRASGWLTDLRDPIDPLLRAALGLPAP